MIGIPKLKKECQGPQAPRINIPASVDWVASGAVTDVRQQGFCGGCYAFSAIAATEGLKWKKTRQLVPLSDQQLIDCSESYDNSGCNGGRMDNSFFYISDNGIANRSSYPYNGYKSNCKYTTSMKTFQLSGCTMVTPNN
jgi:C1A family cysteine protease